MVGKDVSECSWGYMVFDSIDSVTVYVRVIIEVFLGNVLSET